MFSPQREPSTMAVTGGLLLLAGVVPILIDGMIRQQIAVGLFPFFFQGGQHYVPGLLLLAALVVLAIGIPTTKRVPRKPLLVVTLIGFGLWRLLAPLLASALVSTVVGTLIIAAHAVIGVLAGILLYRSGVIAGWEKWLPIAVVLSSVYVLIASLVPLPFPPSFVPNLLFVITGSLMLISGLLSRRAGTTSNSR